MKKFLDWLNENYLNNRRIDPVKVFINRQEVHGNWLDVNDAKEYVQNQIFPGKKIVWENGGELFGINDIDGDLYGKVGKVKILIRQPYEHT